MSDVYGTLAGIAFVILAAANVVLMLEASRPARSVTTRSRLLSVHRASGYLFVILFCIMVYSMSQKLIGVGITGHLPTYLVVHIVLVLALAPLLLLKIFIARRHKQSRSALKALGVTIFLVSFLLVAIPMFSELLRSASPGSMGSMVAASLVVGVCLVQCGLAFKKKKSPVLAETPVPITAVTDNGNDRSLIALLLTQTLQQTHDTRTLRFQVLNERRVCPKPGQFLTFQWTIDGQRVSRSYTISSSPARENYVEITSKRTENGRVSVFLNEQAKPGLAVEASGPYGQFYFDEALHKSIVLIAAGSGITPMISMLTYIDDLKMPNPVTLLYFVRTDEDIIFRNELARLRSSLSNLKYEVCLSRPDAAWKGRSGHLTEKFVAQSVPDLDSPTFFLCGPKGFMDNAHKILSNLGISKDRILQESFGESERFTRSNPPESGAAETLVFIHSKKVCKASAGSTLLELAEKNGVQIPYGCRQGICGTCSTRVLSGVVHMDVEDGLTDVQKSAGYVLPCVGRITGTVVIAA